MNVEAPLRALLLPGLDGSVELRREMAAALAPELDVTVIGYPHHLVQTYGELTELVAALLPRDQPFVLIAESFSGPIAIEVASRRPAGLRGLILCATFAKVPRPLLAPLRRLVKLMRWPVWPMPLVMAVMMGRWATPVWKARLHSALKALELPVFHRRVMDVEAVDVTVQAHSIQCPVLYLLAHHDRVVTPRSAAELRACTGQLETIELEGPHMLFAAKPLECAANIKRWLAALRR